MHRLVMHGRSGCLYSHRSRSLFARGCCRSTTLLCLPAVACCIVASRVLVMQSFTSVFCDHSDFIHDIAFDWYGQRLATCSSDQKIKVFDQVKGKWSLTAEIKAHSGSVHALSWAHPEFGQVLASCSSDRVVHIYEEQVDGRTGARAWKKQGRLVDSRDSVQDCQFAPRHLGLKLATCSLDGRVRIYES